MADLNGQGGGPGTQDRALEDRGMELAHALVRYVQSRGAPGFQARIGGYAVSVTPLKDPGTPAAEVYDE